VSVNWGRPTKRTVSHICFGCVQLDVERYFSQYTASVLFSECTAQSNRSSVRDFSADEYVFCPETWSFKFFA